MTQAPNIDGILITWGDRLFYPGNRMVKTKPQPKLNGGSTQQPAAAIRARIEATVVRRAPQVMVKVTGGGRGMKAIAAHFRYISKNGRLEIEDQRGEKMRGKDSVYGLTDEWRLSGSLIPDDAEPGHRREAFNLMLSMPRALELYPQAALDGKLVPQPVAQAATTAGDAAALKLLAAVGYSALLLAVPWGHHAVLMDKVKDAAARQWYVQASVENGWSRYQLQDQIHAASHQCKGKAASNFSLRLPAPDSALIQQPIKDIYLFDFLTLQALFHAHEVETGLIQHLEKFLLKLGQGALGQAHRCGEHLAAQQAGQSVSSTGPWLPTWAPLHQRESTVQRAMLGSWLGGFYAGLIRDCSS
jgi:hypothetical protein